MKDNRCELDQEQIIRIALRDELDSIEAPPAEIAWNRIQNRLTEEGAPNVTRSSTVFWQRFSVAAAALLLIILGGLGFHRAVQVAWPGYFTDRAQVGSLSSDDLTGVGAESKAESEADALNIRSGSGWAPESLGDLLLNQIVGTHVYSGDEEVEVALYLGDEANLMLLRAPAGFSSGVEIFPHALSELNFLNGPVELVQVNEENGLRLTFLAGEQPGVAWTGDGYLYALWVASGNMSESELQGLSALLAE